MEERRFNKLNYIIRYPKNYIDGEKYPVLFSLHGAGTRGDDINVLKEGLIFSITAETDNFPFIIVAPHCTENTWFDMFEDLRALLKEIANAPFADAARIYGIGASMGGYGIWQLGMSMPEYFAAIAPICGGGMYWNAGRLKNVPIWAFHGALDNVVLVEESIKMVRSVNNNGGCAKLTIYPDAFHDSWTAAYKDSGVFDWFLEHENKNIKEITNDFEGSEIYG